MLKTPEFASQVTVSPRLLSVMSQTDHGAQAAQAPAHRNEPERLCFILRDCATATSRLRNYRRAKRRATALNEKAMKIIENP